MTNIKKQRNQEPCKSVRSVRPSFQQNKINVSNAMEIKNTFLYVLQNVLYVTTLTQININARIMKALRLIILK